MAGLSRLGLALLLAVSAGPAAAQSGVGRLYVDLERRVAGTYYVAGSIAGYGEVDLLVDTGSSFFVINDLILQVLLQAGTAHYSRDLEGRMADGSIRAVRLYRLTELRLGENCRIPGVEAAVFAGSTRTILGMNVLSQLAPFTFSADPPSLQFGPCAGGAEEEQRVTAVPTLTETISGISD